MKIFFRYLLTGKDNRTYEIARFLLFIGYICVIVFTAVDLFAFGHFDPLNFSMALAGLLFGGAGGIAVKAHTEPGGKHDRS